MSFIETYVREHGPDFLVRVGTAVVIVVVAWLLSRLASRTTRRLFERKGRSSRLATFAGVFEALVHTGILAFGVVMALQKIGLDLTALIAGAGVAGLALGFGAQELVKDVISGFFLITEGVIEADDEIDVDKVSGRVERVGLRMTRIRAADGRLWYVPNGQIKVVGNQSRTWMRAQVSVAITYEQDVARALRCLDDVGQWWVDDNKDIVLGEPSTDASLELGTGAVLVSLAVRVKPGQQGRAERELQLRIKDALAREEIDVPFDRQERKVAS
jgi:moderate conductance mechanosensitive channel